MKKTFVRKRLVSVQRWAEIKAQADPIKRHIMDLMEKHGLGEDYLGRVLEIEREAWEPVKGLDPSLLAEHDAFGAGPYQVSSLPLAVQQWATSKTSWATSETGWAEKHGPGRPAAWTTRDLVTDDALYAWFAIELERGIYRHKNPKGKELKLGPFLKMLFRERKRKPMIISGSKIKTASTARRIHSRAKKLMKNSPSLRTRWEQLLADKLARFFARKLPG